MTVFSPVKEKKKAVAASPRKAGSAMRSKLSTGLFTPNLDDVNERKSEKKTRSLFSLKMLKKRFKKKSKKEAQKEKKKLKETTKQVEAPVKKSH